jgi:hypothetical protein
MFLAKVRDSFNALLPSLPHSVASLPLATLIMRQERRRPASALRYKTLSLHDKELRLMNVTRLVIDVDKRNLHLFGKYKENNTKENRKETN